MATFFEFFKLDLSLLIRGKLVIFWTLLFPALMLVLQMTLFGGGGSLGPVDLAVVNLDNSAASHAYIDFLKQGLTRQRSVRIVLTELIGEPNKPVDAMLTIPKTFGKNGERGLTSRIVWGGKLVDGPAIGATKGLVRGLTDAYNIEASGNPRRVSIAFANASAPSPNHLTYALYLTTGLSGMIILSTSLLGFTAILVGAREGGMFRLYQLFPVSRSAVLISWLCSRLVVTLFSSLIMFFLAWILYDLTVTAGVTQILSAVFVLVLGTGAFLSIGLLIATFSDSVTFSTMIANLLYFPLLFSGNIMVPISNLPNVAQDVLSYLPLNAMVGSLRRFLIGESTIFQETYSVAILLTVSAVCVFIASKKFSWVPAQ
jgi:ABC-2 type transport system permease protein